MAAKNSGIGEVIDAAEVTVAPRGRKAVLDSALVDALASIPEGKAMRLTMFGSTDDKDMRAKIGTNIRKHWNAGRSDKCRINWGSGMPEVSAAPVKADA